MAACGLFAPLFPQVYPQDMWTTLLDSRLFSGPRANVSGNVILQVAINAPVMVPFDYLLPEKTGPEPRPGQRVRVPLGKNGSRVGVLIGTRQSSPVPMHRLRRALEIMDSEPVLDSDLMALLSWAAGYYQHPPGEVFAAALPVALRQGKAATGTEPADAGLSWVITAAGRAVDIVALRKKAPAQAQILEQAGQKADGLSKGELRKITAAWSRVTNILLDRGWLATEQISRPANGMSAPGLESAPVLTADQDLAITEIGSGQGFLVSLLEGVTGSGKTEVYFHCIERQIDAGQQSLMLVPEIGLTPQLIDRFRSRFCEQVAVMHSGLGRRDRLRAWCAARDGSAAVIIGTRSAIFSPLPRAGLIIVDEEHDSSFKQQEGFRYSARDLAVWRGRQLDIPVILGSATPSFESLENVNAERYRRLKLPFRPGAAKPPEFHLIDLRMHESKDGLTTPMIDVMRRHLQQDGQVLVYLNRRGFAPTLLCTGCGLLRECSRCDARMVFHSHRNRLVCHHCGADRPASLVCSDCGGELRPVGQGTERLEQALIALFPDHELVRIDRDTTRKRGEIERRLRQVHDRKASLLLGTQMLAKGHDFPDVTLVVIVDADQGLFGTDFRSAERLAQSIVQVAGRAGRASRPGEVYLQTCFPEHPLLSMLVRKGYSEFAAVAMEERRMSGWPPYSCLALLRAEATLRPPAYAFLQKARELAQPLSGDSIRMLGPAPAPMERRSGRYRGQLLVQADDRGVLQRFLVAWRAQLAAAPEGRKARWSLDVDPVELF